MTLSLKSQQTLQALAEVLLPSGGTLPPGAGDAGVTQRIERLLESLPVRAAKAFGAMVRWWNLAPVLYPGFRRTFRLLTTERQRDWVAAADSSHRAVLAIPLGLLKQLVFMAYSSDPEVEKILGFDYTCRRDGETHGAP